MDVICVLPARLSSTRIPRKPLQEIIGRPLLEWCWRAASAIPAFDRIVVATDSDEIERRARAFGAETVRTSTEHTSGTDRVDEAADLLRAAEEDIVVNFQADEPFIDPGTVEAAVRTVCAQERRGQPAGEPVGEPSGEGENRAPDIATLAAPIRTVAEWRSPGVVKVARAADGRALYFSRGPIPFARDGGPSIECFAQGGEGEAGREGGEGGDRRGGDRREGGESGDRHEQARAGTIAPSPWLRHIGIYACRRPALRRWAGLPPSPLERLEKLEQLRALEAGLRIHIEVGPWTEPGIDLPADIERAKTVLSRGG